MRLFRALAHLVLVLAFVSVTTAQVQAVTCMPVAATAQHHHEATPVAVDHDAHDHGGSAGQHPVHQRDNCQTACCFTAGTLPARAPPTSTIAFHPVRYVVAAQPVFGRAPAPEPGVPKPLA